MAMLMIIFAMALAAPSMGELHKGEHLNLRSALHLDVKGSGAGKSQGVATANLTSYLSDLAFDCNCHFKGLCTCEASLEFMSCISSACSSGKCACGGTDHYMWACGNMSATCPSVGLQCDASGKATCMNQESAVPASVAPTVAPQTVAPTQKIAEPTVAATKSEQSWLDWLKANQFLVRVVAFFIEIIPFLIAAAVYNMYRKQINFKQVPANASRDSFTYPLFGCFSDMKIALLAWCCSPLRWADTMDKAGEPTPGLMQYWKGILVFILLTGLSPLLGGLTSLMLLCLVTVYRQKLRKQYDIQSGKFTVIEDCCTYLWCGCCAIVQEARQVESNRQFK